MRIGVLVGVAVAGLGLDGLLGRVREVAEAGLASAYFSQVLSWDAIDIAALCAREVPGIDVGTAITPTYPRHPIALASQALTAQAVSRNRFTLGIGPSHRPVIEDQFGYSYDRPARHVREYLTALRPLLRGEHVEHRGPTLTAVGQVAVPTAEPPSVLLAALGPVMLRIAGELADGTVTMWTSARTVADYVAPTITDAAARSGRPAPRIVASNIMGVTDDPDGARERITAALGPASQLPSYRSMLDRQGMSGVQETVSVGDESEVAKAVADYAAAGTTELLVSLAGDERDRARTLALLSELHTAHRD